MDLTAIILAGGKSSRMGEDKGLLDIDGTPMITHVIEAVRPLVLELFIVSNQEDYEQFGYTVFEDEFKDKGPMAGIYTGLKNSSTQLNIILSCDIPKIDTQFLIWLIRQHENNMITIPRIEGREHHLIGIYNRQVMGRYKQSLNQNELKLKTINDEIDCNYVDVPSEFSSSIFQNINSREDYLAL